MDKLHDLAFLLLVRGDAVDWEDALAQAQDFYERAKGATR